MSAMNARKQAISAAADTPRTVPRLPRTDAARKTLIIIERDRNALTVLSCGLSRITDMPKGLKPVSSLADALALVEEHRPDIVVCDERFDHRDKDAAHKVLARARKMNRGAIVILYATSLALDGPNGYEAVIDRLYPEKVQTFVQGLVAKADGL
jgi:DNA-binding NarL/FixJ family response regulator